MKYTNFHTKNYKGIKDLDLNLAQDPALSIFTLIGLNESGKTTVLEAINFFQKDIPEDRRHTLIPKNKKLNFNDFVSVKVKLELDEEDELAIKNYAKGIGFNLTKNIGKISIEKRYLFDKSKFSGNKTLWTIEILGSHKGSKNINSLPAKNQKWSQIITYIRKELIPPIIYYPNFLFDFPTRIYLEKTSDESAEQEFYRKVLQDILDSLGQNLTLEEHILERMKSQTEEEQEALDSVINQMSSKITSIVFNAWQNLFKSKGKEIIVKPGKEPREDGTFRYYIEIKLREGSDSYLISERSLGFKWFFAFLLFTEFRKNRNADKGEILFLLDEPASNLHSTAQMKLVSTLENLGNKSKLIYTTHSHHLINSKWLEGAYIIKNKALDYDKELESEPKQTDIEATLYRQFVATSPSQQTYFQPILDSLDYKPSLLEQVPEIIIVEGKYDFYSLHFINDVILNGQFNDLKLYPGGGAGKNSQAIRLYLAWGRKFIVLMDADKAGRDAKQKYVEEFGKVIESKILLLSDIDSKWKNFSTENLFLKDERLKIIKAFEGKAAPYTKNRFNMAVQNLLFFKNSVNLSSSTKDKFIKIFEKLNASLVNN